MSSKVAPEPARKSWSLAVRLTSWYTATSFVIILASTSFLYWALVRNLDHEDDQLLAGKLQVFERLLLQRPDDLFALRQEVEWETPRQEMQIYVRIIDGQGGTLMESQGMPDVSLAATHAGGRDAEAADGRALRVLEQKTTGGAHTIQVALDRTSEESLLSNYRKSLGLVLTLGVMVSALAGMHIALRGLRPLAEITQAACEIRATTLDNRLNTTGLPPELLTLAQTFNEMLDRLEESFQRLARFSADIAHELRNPVNNLRGEAEVALGKDRSPQEYREVLGSSLEELGRLASLIDSLLFLARAEDPHLQMARAATDLGDELKTVRDFFEAAATDQGIHLAVESESGLVCRLDRSLFQRALSNLLANSLAQTPVGGWIRIRAFSENKQIVVEVADNGQGIKADDLPHVFDRFYRADAARASETGHVGLGLAIVKSIASVHGGTVAIESALNRGTVVRMIFPQIGMEPGENHAQPDGSTVMARNASDLNRAE
jgi:two-component system heavy metal sensor histidine kinase CusS